MKSAEKDTEFPEDQKTRLKELIPAYEAFILANNPEHKSRCDALTKWRTDTAKKLIQEDLFQRLISDSGLELKDWEKAIRRYYTNYYNNVYLAGLRRAAGPGPALTSALPPTTSASSSNSNAINNVLRRAIVTFVGDLSAREIFASENEDAIQDAMKKIRVDNPTSDLLGGGLRNKALKVLWKDADKAFWEAKVKALAADVEANCEEFPSLMLLALENLCNRERLSSTLMSFSWAFRNHENDGISGGQIFHGYDMYQHKVVPTKPNDHESHLNSWLSHADSILSRKPRSATYKIPCNEDGVPILPQVADDASEPQVAVLLGEYLESLWDYCWSSELQVPPFPWDNIAINPERYFDTSHFNLPHSLNPPSALKKSATFQLYEYFSSLPESEPFHFYSKKTKPPAAPRVPAPTCGTPTNISLPNPLDHAKDYPEVPQRSMSPFSSNPTPMNNTSSSSLAPGLPHTVPTSINRVQSPSVPRDVDYIPPDIHSPLSNAAISPINVEVAPLFTPASTAPSQKIGRKKTTLKRKGKDPAAQKAPLVMPETPTHPEDNPAPIPNGGRRSARTAPVKRKQPDTDNSKDNEGQPNRKKKKPNWVWVDENGNVVEENPV